MKVLWLTNTPVGFSDNLNIKKKSGGWMASLEAYFRQDKDFDLAVCFFHSGLKQFKMTYNEITYYPIDLKGSSTFTNKLKSKLFNILDDTNKKDVLKAIVDFKPDIIQLFGTESGLGEVLSEVNIPYIIHVQGFINPCLAAWFPKGISQLDLFLNSPFQNIMLKKGFLGEYYLFRKKAEREISIIRSAHYFFGRTDWDKMMIRIYNNEAEYYHCDEILRESFLKASWKANFTDTLHIATTINPNVYKGLDVVMDTAKLLRQTTSLNFVWSIIGIEENNQLVKVIEKIKREKFRNVNVHFEGYKNAHELVLKLLASDIFVHPSHIDNSPNSVCEAMMLGMPVIAGRVGGLPSLIEHRFNGLMYNSHDPFELVGLLIEASNNITVMERLGTNARLTAKKRHEPLTIMDGIKQTYLNIIAEYKSLSL